MAPRNVGLNSTFNEQRLVINALSVDLDNLSNAGFLTAFNLVGYATQGYVNNSIVGFITSGASGSNLTGIPTYITAGSGISVDQNTGNVTITATSSPYSTIAGIATYATTAGVSTSVSGGSASVSHLNVTGISTFQNNVYIPTAKVLYLGNNNDFQIYHALSQGNSVIRDVGIGSLFIASSPAVRITSSGFDPIAVFNDVGSVELYFNNIKEFETTGYGATVYGTLQSQGLNVSGVTTSTGGFVGNLTGNASSATYAITAGVSTVSQGLDGTPNINVGIVTATSFVKSGGTSSQFLKADGSVDTNTYLTTTGSGTNLTGIVTSIVAGTNVTVSGSTGQVTINATGGGGSSQWVTTTAGIHTLSNVGIGTTDPTNGLALSYSNIIEFKTNQDNSRNLILIGDENVANPSGRTGESGGIYIGQNAAPSLTSAGQNTVIGASAALQLTTGASNTIIGVSAGTGLTTSNGNTILGHGAGADVEYGNHNLVLGNNGVGGGYPTPNVKLGNGNIVIGTWDPAASLAPNVPISGGNRQLVIGAGATNWINGNSNFFVGIGTTNPTEKLTVSGKIQLNQLEDSSSRLIFRAKPGNLFRWNIDNDASNTFRIFTEDDATTLNGAVRLSISTTGTVTAAKFSGDGSLLTGIIATGSGVGIQNQGSNIGIATIINFSTNLTASFSSGTATISLSNNPSISGILTADQVYTSNNNNGQNVRIGDDFWIGDVNVANTTRFSGAQDSTKAFVIFGSSDAVALGRTGTGPLYYGGNFTVAGIVTASSFSGNASSATYATSSDTSNYSTTSGISTYATSSGIATYATSSGIATYATSSGIATYSINSGVSTSVIGGTASVTQLQSTGVSTFTNGPVLIGSGTSTGTASQPLQVTGGAYVSGNLGVGVTNPASRIDIHSPTSGSTAIRATSGPNYSANLYPGVISGLSTNGASANGSQFVAAGIGFTSGELGVYTFYPTFANFPSDKGPRRAVDLVGGFSTGVWGTEYFSINVGKNGSDNDAGTLTNERLRVDGSGNVGIATTNPSTKLHVVGDSTVSGVTNLNQVTETVVNAFNTTLAPSTGTLTVDTSQGTVVLGDLNASVTTWAFTNVPTANSKATTITLIIDGDTAQTYGDACSVNGSAITNGVKWSGGSAPTATNNFDIITFTIVKDSAGTINVFGSGNTDFS